MKKITSAVIFIVFAIIFLSLPFNKFKNNKAAHITIEENLKNLYVLPAYRFYFRFINNRLFLQPPKYFDHTDFDLVILEDWKTSENGDLFIVIFSLKNQPIYFFKIPKKENLIIDIPKFLNIGGFKIFDISNKRLLFKYDKLKNFAICNENQKCETGEEYFCSQDCNFIKNPYYPLPYRKNYFLEEAKEILRNSFSYEEKKKFIAKCEIPQACECLDKKIFNLLENPLMQEKLSKLSEHFALDSKELVKILIMTESRCNPELFHKRIHKLELGLLQISTSHIFENKEIIYECNKILKRDYKLESPPNIRDENFWKNHFIFKDTEFNLCYGIHLLLINGCNEKDDLRKKLLKIYLGYNRGKSICKFLRKNNIDIFDYSMSRWEFQSCNFLSCFSNKVVWQ